MQNGVFNLYVMRYNLSIKIISIIFLIVLSGLGNLYGQQATIRIGLWQDGDLSKWGGTEASDLKRLFEETGGKIALLSTDDLLLEEKLNTKNVNILVLPYAAYPAIGSKVLNQFLSHGGNLIVLEGNPFNRLLFKDGKKWMPSDLFSSVERELNGKGRWSLGVSDRLMTEGLGTVVDPYILSAKKLGGYTDAGFPVSGLSSATSAFVFEIRSNHTHAIILEAREKDGSRWKHVVSVSPQWKEIRVHFGSFYPYAAKKGAGSLSYIRPELLKAIYFGMLRSGVGSGSKHFEVRNMRFMKGAVGPGIPARMDVPMPGRQAVERVYGNLIAKGTEEKWPQMFVDAPLVNLSKIAPNTGYILANNLPQVNFKRSLESWLLEAPLIKFNSKGSVLKTKERFIPIYSDLNGNFGARETVAAIFISSGKGGRGNVKFAFGLNGLNLADRNVSPLRNLIHQVVSYINSGVYLFDASPSFHMNSNAQAEISLHTAFGGTQIANPKLKFRSVVKSANFELVDTVQVSGNTPWFKSPIDGFNWRNYTIQNELYNGKQMTDQIEWKVDVRTAVRDLSDFLVKAGRSGKFSGVYFVDSRGARTLLGAYELFGDNRYLETAIKWANVMMAEQREDGGYRMGYGITSKGEECYVADGGEIALGIARIAAYMEKKEQAKLLHSLKRYMDFRAGFRVSTGGIGVGWCIQDYSARPIVPLPKAARVYGAERNIYTISCTLGASWAYYSFIKDTAGIRTTIKDGGWYQSRSPLLTGAAAESYIYAHKLSTSKVLKDQYANYLLAALVPERAKNNLSWWVDVNGGRASLDLHSLVYVYENIKKDSRILAQMSRAVSAIASEQSAESIYRLIGRDDLQFNEWVYLCYSGLGLLEAIEPGITLRKII
ncbi:hypothetical protein SAMN04488101_11440 [Pedobacter nyackensis]|uniref:Uncharacterized protein n=2 Tax=Pedobacter nyackensis TaxID=475255 RepID=A0A1W2EP88_9SPHI|nr:hypothetical protein SAMN04488101_11440 [Pedobacter nyackensis]